MKRRATYSERKTRQPCFNNCCGKPPNYIWQPAVPSWEKEFTLKVGLFQWEKFIEAKKMTFPSDKINQWNDSAGEEAFNTAKKYFWEEYNSLPFSVRLPNPDMYIDQIDWNSGPDPTLISDVERSADEMPTNFQAFCYKPQVVEIKPTGWDVDIEETGDLLTGLIVGDDDADNRNVLLDRLNFDGEPSLRKFRQIVLGSNFCGKFVVDH